MNLTLLGTGSADGWPAAGSARIDSVTLDVCRTEAAQAGERSTHAVGVQAHSGNQSINIEDVVAHRRQILNARLRQDFSDR